MFEAVDEEPRVRIVVLRAVGDHFSSGGNIKGFLEASPEHVSKLAWNIAAPARCTKPVSYTHLDVYKRQARSCLTLAVQVEGADIRTVEGLAPAADRLSPLQNAFRENYGLQCGFCTPGILMSLDALPVSYTHLQKSSYRRKLEPVAISVAKSPFTFWQAPNCY